MINIKSLPEPQKALLLSMEINFSAMAYCLELQRQFKPATEEDILKILTTALTAGYIAGVRYERHKHRQNTAKATRRTNI